MFCIVSPKSPRDLGAPKVLGAEVVVVTFTLFWVVPFSDRFRARDLRLSGPKTGPQKETKTGPKVLRERKSENFHVSVARQADMRIPKEKQHSEGPDSIFRYPPRPAATDVSAHMAPFIQVIVMVSSCSHIIFFYFFRAKVMFLGGPKRGPKKGAR